MSWRDPIVEEVRQARDAYAKQFNYDLDAIYRDLKMKEGQDIHRIAARQLEQHHAATMLDTLRVPSGNRLEALTNDRQGQHSIRVNDQWRVCFVWRDGDAYDVEIVDYH